LMKRMQVLSQVHTPPPIVSGQPTRSVMRGAWQDVVYAARSMRRQPGFALTIVVTLALGIAVNMTAFTIVNGAALRPLPFQDSDELVQVNVRNVANARSQDSELSYQEFQDWRAANPRTLEYIVGTDERGVDISGDDRPPRRVAAAFVSWDTFAMLPQPPAIGRDFQESDDRAGAAPVVIIGWSLWQSRYGGDPAIVGRTIRANGVPSTIVGVMPENFGFPYRIEFWLPLAALPERDRAARSARVLDGFARLRSGATIEQATAELSGITTSLAERYPETNRNIAPFITPYGIATQFVAVLVALLGAVGFVLFIACANVANLFLARAADRARDVTLRMALGASRWRIVRQLLVESLLLAAVGSVLGLALSYPGIQLFTNAAMEETPSTMQFTMDLAVFAYLIALCFGSAVVCSLVPSWYASRTSLATTLNDAGRGSAGSRQRRRWTGAFVVAQVTLALVLLSGAMLMIKNLVGLMQTDVGIEASGLSQMAIILGPRHDTPARRLLFLNQLEERLAQGQAVVAALASHPPFGGALVRRVRYDGAAAADLEALPQVSVVGIGDRYFDVVGVPIIAGRSLSADEVRQASDSIVVNERFVRMNVAGGIAVGQRILLVESSAVPGEGAGPRWMTIVGVVGNVRQRWLPSGDFDPVVYAPYSADPPQTVEVLARSALGPAAAASFVGDHVRSLEPDLPLLPVMTTDQFLARMLWAQQVFGSMFAAFAAIAMLLATCGLYAVTAYAVSRRTREIGVRIALGADARRVWLAVAGTTLRQLAIGLVLGTAGAVAVATVLPAILVGTGGSNFLTIAGVAIVLVASGIVASAVPARRAMRLDPTTALQAE
ncbi:MAG TPA: ABC transporter permease, partial [Vicinamibacterales bacterium]|nr:ABC transporter permease [Vicinamibacterales bacterium]